MTRKSGTNSGGTLHNSELSIMSPEFQEFTRQQFEAAEKQKEGL